MNQKESQDRNFGHTLSDAKESKNQQEKLRQRKQLLNKESFSYVTFRNPTDLIESGYFLVYSTDVDKDLSKISLVTQLSFIKEVFLDLLPGIRPTVAYLKYMLATI